MIKSHTYTWVKPWPHLLITGAIHGDEPCGTIAIQKFIGQIEQWSVYIASWTVTLIPICNPKAYKQNTRYIEKNLNRIFTKHKNPDSYEQALANELTSYVDRCDVILDIHSAHTAGPPNVFQDYISKENESLAKSTGIELIIQWRPEIYTTQGKSEIRDSIWYAHNLWKQWVLIECWQHTDSKAPDVAYVALRNIMNHLNICTHQNTPKTLSCKTIYMTKIVYKRKKWSFSRDRYHGEYIHAWQKIAACIDWESIFAPCNGYILLPNPKAKTWEERFYIWK